MTSRGASNPDRPKGRRAGERPTAQSLSLPSQPRPSPKSHTHGAQRSSKPMATYSTSRFDQDEESDDPAPYRSDVSMEDGNEQAPRKHSPPARTGDLRTHANRGPKSSGQFMPHVEWVIEQGTECIEWAEEGSGAILIRNDSKFENETLRDHFNGIKPGSFEKQMRNYGYQKKKTATGSLWVRKDPPLPDDPTQLDMAQEVPLPPSTRTAASMASRTSAHSDLKARMDEFEAKLSTTTSELETTQLELDATRSELKKMQKLLSESMDEVKMLTTLLRRVFGRDTAEPVSSGNGPSHSVPDSGPGPVASHSPSHMNHANGYGGDPYGSSLKLQASAYGAAAPWGAPLVPDIGMSYGSAGPTLPPEQPTRPHVSGYGSDASPGIPQTYHVRPTVSGGSFPHVLLSQQSGPIAMPQEAGTSSGRHQNSAYAAGAPSYYSYGPPASSSPLTFTPPASTRSQPSNHSGASAGPRRQIGVATVPRMTNPNISNYSS